MSPTFRWPEDEVPAGEMFELLRSGRLYVDGDMEEGQVVLRRGG